MYLKTILCSAAAVLLVVAPPAHAQGKKKAKAGDGADQVRLSLPVENLTPENSERARAGLDAMTAQVFECPQCHEVVAAGGTCPACGVATKYVKKPLLADVELDPASSTVSCRVSGLGPVHLGQLSAALGRAGVRVQTEKVVVPGPAVLVFSGGTADEPGPALEKALGAARLYGGARAYPDEASGTIRVQVSPGGAKKPLHESIVEAAQDPGLPKLTDVVWGEKAKVKSPDAAKKPGADEKTGKKKKKKKNR